MPSFEHHGAHIYYEELGRGFPILTFAPAGLQSVIDVWSQPSAPINPTTEWAADFRVIAMDQRNAGGQSRAPITAQDGWDSYTADHIALLDHLRRRLPPPPQRPDGLGKRLLHPERDAGGLAASRAASLHGPACRLQSACNRAVQGTHRQNSCRLPVPPSILLSA